MTELEQQRFQLTTEEKQLRQKLADEKRTHTQVKNDLKVTAMMMNLCVLNLIFVYFIESTKSCRNIESVSGETTKAC